MKRAISAFDSILIKKLKTGRWLIVLSPHAGNTPLDDCETLLYEPNVSFSDVHSSHDAACQLLSSLDLLDLFRPATYCPKKDRGWLVYQLEIVE